MAYTIEIICVGTDKYREVQKVIELLTSVQDQFIFITPPKGSKNIGLSYALANYTTSEIYEWLTEYRRNAKGVHPYLIAVISGHLRSREYNHLFGSHKAEEGFAIISLFDFDKFVESETAYLAYYFARYGLSFVNPEWKNHKDTRTCYFDKKIIKRDIRLSLLSSGALCGECTRNFNKFFDEDIYEAFAKMAQLVTALEVKDYEKIGSMTGRNELPKIVILTAIKEEYNAICQHLVEVKDIRKDGTFYASGFFEFEGRRIARVIVRECGPKNTTASQEVERAINFFGPKMMLFVGIAGSRKPKDFGVGDVVFSEKVYSYEGGKATAEELKARPDSIPSTYVLFELAKNECKKDDWKRLVKHENINGIKAGIGIIASGEKVVEHHDADVGLILDKHYNDASAVEMEGYGFMRAMQRQGDNAAGIIFGVVRGISDILERENRADPPTVDNAERRPDDVKQFASATAAAFAFWLIGKFYGDEDIDE